MFTMFLMQLKSKLLIPNKLARHQFEQNVEQREDVARPCMIFMLGWLSPTATYIELF